MTAITKEQVAATIATTRAVADAIKELGSVPNGHLYAQLMGVLDFETYSAIIRFLKKTEIIREENHLLIWNAAK